MTTNVVVVRADEAVALMRGPARRGATRRRFRPARARGARLRGRRTVGAPCDTARVYRIPGRWPKRARSSGARGDHGVEHRVVRGRARSPDRERRARVGCTRFVSRTPTKPASGSIHKLVPVKPRCPNVRGPKRAPELGVFAAPRVEAREERAAGARAHERREVRVRRANPAVFRRARRARRRRAAPRRGPSPKRPAWPEVPSPDSAKAFSSCTTPRTRPPRKGTISVGATRSSKDASRRRACRAEPIDEAERRP